MSSFRNKHLNSEVTVTEENYNRLCSTVYRSIVDYLVLHPKPRDRKIWNLIGHLFQDGVFRVILEIYEDSDK